MSEIPCIKETTITKEYLVNAIKKELNLNIMLLIGDKKKHYVSKGKLINALETYRTIVTWD